MQPGAKVAEIARQHEIFVIPALVVLNFPSEFIHSHKKHGSVSGSIHPVQQQLASSFSNAIPER